MAAIKKLIAFFVRGIYAHSFDIAEHQKCVFEMGIAFVIES